MCVLQVKFDFKLKFFNLLSKNGMFWLLHGFILDLG